MKPRTARSLMTDSIVTISPELSLWGVLRLFVEEDIHGAPVVDADGRAIGVLTSSDVLRAQMDEQYSVSEEKDYMEDSVEFSAPHRYPEDTDFQDRMTQRTAADVMTNGVISVRPDAGVEEIARCLRENRIHRVWVEDEGRLLGVVSAIDLMPVLEARPRETGDR